MYPSPDRAGEYRVQSFSPQLPSPSLNPKIFHQSCFEDKPKDIPDLSREKIQVEYRNIFRRKEEQIVFSYKELLSSVLI